MRNIEVKHGQTIEDVAIQEYGSLEGLVPLVSDNGLSMDALLPVGMVLKIRTDLTFLTSDSREVLRYLKQKQVEPNTLMAGDATSYVEDDYVEEDYVE